jgi:exonuclease VII small subunit
MTELSPTLKAIKVELESRLKSLKEIQSTIEKGIANLEDDLKRLEEKN